LSQLFGKITKFLNSSTSDFLLFIKTYYYIGHDFQLISMIKKITLFLFIFFAANPLLQGQNVTFYEQINGRYDFTFVGNTLNTGENNVQATLSYLTSSSANLNLGSNDVVHKAYLYWAGSGMGDFNVKLNGEDISAQRTFQHSRFIGTTLYHFFGAFTDVTNLVQTTGNGDYTFSDLDIASDLSSVSFLYRNQVFLVGLW